MSLGERHTSSGITSPEQEGDKKDDHAGKRSKTENVSPSKGNFALRRKKHEQGKWGGCSTFLTGGNQDKR